MNVGDLRVDPVIDGVGTFPATMAFQGTTTDQWADHTDLLHPDGSVDLAYGGFLLRGVDERIVLVDAGVGDTIKWGDYFYEAGRFLHSLASYGVAPEDVTDVILTHLHYDHIGWTTRGGSVVFPNATYRCHELDWQYFVNPDNQGASRKLSPVAGQLETWSGDRQLLPGVDTLFAPGHTPGSTIIVVSSGTARAVLLGDVVHCPVQLIDPEWAAIADVDPKQALATREAVARELEGANVPAAASHFAGLQFGRLIASDGGRRWQF